MGLTKLGRYLAESDPHLTHEQFAVLARVPAPMVSMWSRRQCAAKRVPGLDNALKIEAATGGAVPASYWPKLAKRLRRSARAA